MKNIPIRKINTPSQSGNYSIRKIEDLLDGKDLVQNIHRHDFYLILVLEKAKGEHVIDFIHYSVAGHTVFFLRPGQVHQLTLKRGSLGYIIEFNSEWFTTGETKVNHLIRKACFENCCVIDPHRFKKIRSLSNSIYEEYSNQQERYKEAIQSIMNQFFIEMIREHKTARPSTPKNLYAQERLEEFLELLRSHVSTHKQVADYSDMLHLTPYQLNAITKSMLGKTCSELINETIQLEAKRYLLATTNQINQIASQLGYEDISYFIRFFKKQSGYSPEAFRQKFK
jgi:AraC-like DNA-binding protein